MQPLDRITTPVLSEQGEVLGHVEFADQGGRPTIEFFESAAFYASSVCLLEDQSYEIAFHRSSVAVTGVRPRFSAPFIPSRLAHGAFVGILPSSRFVGSTVLEFCDEAGLRIASISVEVRSRKLEYLTEFYAMLDDLSGIAVDLVTTLKSAFNTRLRIDPYVTASTVQQRLLFLKSICERQDIFAAFNRIEALPHTRLVAKTRSHAISKATATSREFAASMLTSRDRLKVPLGHPLSGRLKTVPAYVASVEKHESADTAENRFAKYVVTSFIAFVERAAALLRNTNWADRTLMRWLTDTDAAFKEIASRPIFKGVGRLSVLPIGSPTLQRKHGYRQILDAWLKFNSASRVNWQALDDVFEAGQRDAALLYEYWCFFILRESISSAFALEEADQSGVLRPTDDGLSIALKVGQEAAIRAQFVFRGKRFGLRYAFQRQFRTRSVQRAGHYLHTDPHRGSWSKRMDPDFTVSIWPHVDGIPDGGESAAEAKGEVAHVHFDAKYRITHNNEEADSTNGLGRWRAKGDDVDKMHAYLNAIRGSCGAYVLYPGQVTEFYCEATESIPGVGFIAVRPGSSGAGKEEVRAHLLNVMEALYVRFQS